MVYPQSKYNRSSHFSSHRFTFGSRYSKMQDSRHLQRREELKSDAQSTLKRLPDILGELHRTKEARMSKKFSTHDLRYMEPGRCPEYSRPAVIRVLNKDTINAAIELAAQTTDDPGAAHDSNTANSRPLIVNFANPEKPCGGWLNGQIAQEEALCYRSSLSLSLHRHMYPLRWNEVIYSPYVLIIRDDMAHGHRYYPGSPSRFPSVSCVTVAALRSPELMKFTYKSSTGPREKTVFFDDRDRSYTKVKMRQTLRAAASNNHRLLVLGALGCGVHKNPPEDVAHCWLEVLREHEFAGNWWREVWFAVYDPYNDGTYATFDQVLSGQKV